jgi:hypothetical protein
MQFLAKLVVVHYLVVDMIFTFKIKQIKIIHLQVLDIHIFIQIILIRMHQQVKNFKVLNKVLILRQNNIKFINLYSNSKFYEILFLSIFLIFNLVNLIIKIIVII